MKFIPTYRPPLLHRKYKHSWYSFLLEAKSISGSLCGRNDYVSEKLQWHQLSSLYRSASFNFASACPWILICLGKYAKFVGAFRQPLFLWKRNNAFSVNCWSNFHCKRYKNIKCCKPKFLLQIYSAGNNKMNVSANIKCIFLSDCKQFKFSRYIFINNPNTKFCGNSCSGSCAAACGQRDRRAEGNKLFRDFANAPKNGKNF